MNCSVERKDPIISVTEKGKTFRLDNPNRRPIVQVKVDGCLITGERERCDYLFEVPLDPPPPSHRICYVELKGKHVEKAISQIISTIEYTKQQYVKYKKEAYIVSSRVPTESPSTQAIRITLKRDYGAKLIIRCNELVEEVP
jgi:hypothetical protein